MNVFVPVPSELNAVPVRLGRHAFYDRARAAFAVVMTGDVAKYGNIMLTKGVTPPGED